MKKVMVSKFEKTALHEYKKVFQELTTKFMNKLNEKNTV